LAELSPEAVQRLLALLEKAAWNVPVAAARFDVAAGEQHLAVTLQQALDGRRRVGVVVRAAAGAREMAPVAPVQLLPAARTEPPAVEDPHGLGGYGQTRRRRARKPA